jgi:hypothetical protein
MPKILRWGNSPNLRFSTQKTILKKGRGGVNQLPRFGCYIAENEMVN